MSARQLEMETLNVRLNASEFALRERIGAAKVDDLIVRFRAAAADYPPLFLELYAKRDPYRWLAQYWAPRHERTQKGVEVLRRVLEQRPLH